MTNKKFFANQIFYCSSAVLAAAAGALWLLLACVVEHVSSETDTHEIPCAVNIDDSMGTTSSQNICRIQSPVKVIFRSSYRRPDQNIPAPFVFVPAQTVSGCADNSASITPALPPAANPATYVRAGPEPA